MKTVIISSSLSKTSKSFILCNEVNQKLKDLGFKSEIIDARSISLNAYHLIQSKELDDLSNKISKADNLIIAMGVHNFSINDSLKIILDTCFKNVEGKVEFVHTLNGSGLATPRIFASLIETHQNEDGSISIPVALQPYLGISEIK